MDLARARWLTSLLLVAGLAGAGCGGGDDKAGGAGASPSKSKKAAAAVSVRPFLGVTAGAPLGTPAVSFDRELATMAASGVHTMRTALYWRDAQPVSPKTKLPPAYRRALPLRNGVPTTLSGFDRLALSAARHRVALLPVVASTPDWAARHPKKAGSPPSGTKPYANFLTTLIERYGPKGGLWREHPEVRPLPIRDWQIWNEPNHLVYWSDQPFARDYVRLLRAAHTAIKKADPGARVVLGGFADRSWDLLEQVYRAGGRDSFDVAATHPYTFEPANVLKIVQLDRATMRRHGDATKPLWLTEVTWSSGKGKVDRPLGFETTPRDQAARLSRALPVLARQRKALGIQRMYWESWVTLDRNRQNPFDFSGLRRVGRGQRSVPKPAYSAFVKVANRLRPCGTRSVAGICP